MDVNGDKTVRQVLLADPNPYTVHTIVDIYTYIHTYIYSLMNYEQRKEIKIIHAYIVYLLCYIIGFKNILP